MPSNTNYTPEEDFDTKKGIWDFQQEMRKQIGMDYEVPRPEGFKVPGQIEGQDVYVDMDFGEEIKSQIVSGRDIDREERIARGELDPRSGFEKLGDHSEFARTAHRLYHDPNTNFMTYPFEGLQNFISDEITAEMLNPTTIETPLGDIPYGDVVGGMGEFIGRDPKKAYRERYGRDWMPFPMIEAKLKSGQIDRAEAMRIVADQQGFWKNLPGNLKHLVEGGSQLIHTAGDWFARAAGIPFHKDPLKEGWETQQQFARGVGKFADYMGADLMQFGSDMARYSRTRPIDTAMWMIAPTAPIKVVGAGKAALKAPLGKGLKQRAQAFKYSYMQNSALDYVRGAARTIFANLPIGNYAKQVIADLYAGTAEAFKSKKVGARLGAHADRQRWDEAIWQAFQKRGLMPEDPQVKANLAYAFQEGIRHVQDRKDLALLLRRLVVDHKLAEKGVQVNFGPRTLSNERFMSPEMRGEALYGTPKIVPETAVKPTGEPRVVKADIPEGYEWLDGPRGEVPKSPDFFKDPTPTRHWTPEGEFVSGSPMHDIPIQPREGMPKLSEQQKREWKIEQSFKPLNERQASKKTGEVFTGWLDNDFFKWIFKEDPSFKGYHANWKLEDLPWNKGREDHLTRSQMMQLDGTGEILVDFNIPPELAGRGKDWQTFFFGYGGLQDLNPRLFYDYAKLSKQFNEQLGRPGAIDNIYQYTIEELVKSMNTQRGRTRTAMDPKVAEAFPYFEQAVKNLEAKYKKSGMEQIGKEFIAFTRSPKAAKAGGDIWEPKQGELPLSETPIAQGYDALLGEMQQMQGVVDAAIQGVDTVVDGPVRVVDPEGLRGSKAEAEFRGYESEPPLLPEVAPPTKPLSPLEESVKGIDDWAEGVSAKAEKHYDRLPLTEAERISKGELLIFDEELKLKPLMENEFSRIENIEVATEQRAILGEGKRLLKDELDAPPKVEPVDAGKKISEAAKVEAESHYEHAMHYLGEGTNKKPKTLINAFNWKLKKLTEHIDKHNSEGPYGLRKSQERGALYHLQEYEKLTGKKVLPDPYSEYSQSVRDVSEPIQIAGKAGVRDVHGNRFFKYYGYNDFGELGVMDISLRPRAGPKRYQWHEETGDLTESFPTQKKAKEWLQKVSDDNLKKLNEKAAAYKASKVTPAAGVEDVKANLQKVSDALSEISGTKHLESQYDLAAANKGYSLDWKKFNQDLWEYAREKHGTLKTKWEAEGIPFEEGTLGARLAQEPDWRAFTPESYTEFVSLNPPEKYFIDPVNFYRDVDPAKPTSVVEMGDVRGGEVVDAVTGPLSEKGALNLTMERLSKYHEQVARLEASKSKLETKKILDELNETLKARAALIKERAALSRKARLDKVIEERGPLPPPDPADLKYAPRGTKEALEKLDRVEKPRDIDPDSIVTEGELRFMPEEMAAEYERLKYMEGEMEAIARMDPKYNPEVDALVKKINSYQPKFMIWYYDGVPMTSAEFLLDVAPKVWDRNKITYTVLPDAPPEIQKYADVLLNFKKLMMDLGQAKIQAKGNASDKGAFLVEDMFKAIFPSYLPQAKRPKLTPEAQWEEANKGILADLGAKQGVTIGAKGELLGVKDPRRWSDDPKTLQKRKDDGFNVEENFLLGLDMMMPRLIDTVHRYKLYTELAELAGFAIDGPAPGYTLMTGKPLLRRAAEEGGNIERYGPLEGKYIPNEAARVIKATEKHVDKTFGVWGGMKDAHRRLLNMAKHNLLIANHTTQAHNVIGQHFVLAMEHPGDPLRYFKNIPELVRGYDNPIYVSWAETGKVPIATPGIGDVSKILESAKNAKSPAQFLKLMLDDFERTAKLAGVDKAAHGMAKQAPELALQGMEYASYKVFGINGQLAKWFTASDRLARYTLYKRRIQELADAHGITLEQALKEPKLTNRAADYQNEVMLDYSDLPLGIQAIRESGIQPFIAYPFRATRYMLEYPLRHPGKSFAAHKYSDFARKDESLEEWENQQAAYPGDVAYQFSPQAQGNINAALESVGGHGYDPLMWSTRWMNPLPYFPQETLGYNVDRFSHQNIFDKDPSYLDKHGTIAKATGLPIPTPLHIDPIATAVSKTAEEGLVEGAKAGAKKFAPPYVNKLLRSKVWGMPVSPQDRVLQGLTPLKFYPTEHIAANKRRAKQTRGDVGRRARKTKNKSDPARTYEEVKAREKRAINDIISDAIMGGVK